MAILRKKHKVAAIALALVLTVSATLITCLPAVNALTFPTYAFISASPNPVGLGQNVIVVFWLSYPSPASGFGFGLNWNGFTVEITKPDHHTENKGPYMSDATGSAYLLYVPDQTGTYYFEFSFPGQWVNTTTFNNYYRPSTSNIFALTVQQQPIVGLTEAPFPTGYWARPINAENRGWASISGDWLMPAYNMSRTFDNGVAFNPYTTVPNSPHIVWTKPLGQGGSIGGPYGGIPYFTGSSYRRELLPPVILNGKLYYTYRDAGQSGLGLFGVPTGYGPTYCVDLRTGQTVWVENISITLGQIVNMVNPNEAGGMAYLWDTNGYTWYRYDAFSGRLMTTLTGAMPMDTSGINVPVMFDQNGNILYYIMNGAPFTQNWLAMWNSSLAAPTGTFANWGVGTFPWNAGIQWNVTIPRGGLSAFSTNSVQQISRDVLIGGNYSLFAAMAGSAWDYVYEGYSTKNGRLIWNQTYTNLMQLGGFHAVRITDNVWYILDPGTMKTVAFDLYTGERLWTSQAKTNPWDIYNMGYSGAYGKIYSIGMSGMIYTYDLKTGKTLWTWGPVNSGLETFYGNYSLYGGFVIADNKIIVCDGEHGHGAYEWRGAKMHAVDATSGKTLWNILGWWQQPNIADGYIIAPNGYDGNIYCFGKGQTAITVSAPMTAVTNGSSVLIQGTVTDQSPGAVGTPCVSDQSMEGWMEYLYEQQPMPTNATGVPVLLQAMYPDGSVHDIATVTSDIMGHYEYMWTPPTTGTYKILATFAGSNSYFASSAETGLGVAAAPAPAYITTAAVAPDYTPMFAGIIVAVVIAIVLVIYDVFRKRK